jgi:serine-type D-Ala-D-Ala carboxypeptidase (penicillin-binding protein 5/6)
VLVSEKAWHTPGSRMFIEVNTRVSVEDLLQGMIVQSGNDASVALAEHTAGSEDAFVELMNQYAQSLGMSDTTYMNSTGLPAEGHLSTAHDVALLARALITEFPEYYRWYSQREFTYNEITQHNRNLLLWRDSSVDGLKTGHTDDAGYCLVASAERSGMRLISVVMGMSSEDARASGSEALLNYGFRFFETHKLYTGGDEVTSVKVWKGERDSIGLALADDLYVTIPRGRYDALAAAMSVPDALTAPLEASAKIGEVSVSLDGETLASAPLIAIDSVGAGSLWSRLKDDVLMWLE